SHAAAGARTARLSPWGGRLAAGSLGRLQRRQRVQRGPGRGALRAGRRLLSGSVSRWLSRRRRARVGAVGGSAARGLRGASHRHAAHAQRFGEGLERELAGRYSLEGEAEVSRDGGVRLIRARALRHDRPVTLKVVNPSLASVLDVERFLREIKLTARLQHPHILPLLDSGEVGGRPWYAVPRPDGETLRARLNREPRVPLEEAVRFTRELADGLEHAHAQGVIHRDVSPENVLL